MANNALIGAVRAEATLESGKFVSGAKKIRKEAKQTETALVSSFKTMGAAAKGFGGALAAGLSIGLLAGAAKRALDYAGSLGEVAQSLGVTTKELQTFRFAVQQNGGTVEQADQALGKFALSISKARQGSKQAAEAFAAAGVKLKDLETKSKTEILGIIADEFKRTGGAAANAAAGVAIFGKGFLKIGPTLDQGSQGLNQLSAAAEKLGIVLSDEQIRRADETADKLDAVRTVLAAQIAGVVTDNANSIVSLANALATLTSSVVNFLGSNPQAALAIIGGLAGSRFGLPGAAVGALGGFVAGERVAAGARDANLDLGFRKQQLAAARKNFSNARRLTSKTAPDAQVKATEKELRKQIELMGAANAAARRRLAAPAGATASLPQFLGSGGGSKKGGKGPRAPRDRSDDVAFQFDQELKRAQIDVLRAQQGLARTSEERATIALQLLDAERQMQEAELQDRVRRAERDFAEGKITAGTLEEVKVQADKLRAEYDSKDALDRKAIADNLAADQAQDAAQLAQTQDAAQLAQTADDIQMEKLQLEASLAETASERRDAELRILALMKDQEKARLEAVLADQDSSDLARAEAQLRLDNLDAIYAGRADVVEQGTRGPMEDWLAQLPTTAAKAQEAFEQLQVQGFEGLIDAAVALTEGFDSAKDALLNTLKQFLQGMLRMQLQQGLGSLFGSGGFNLGSLFGGGSSGSSTPIFTPSNPGVGFAGGGSFTIMGRTGIDRNTLQLNGIPIANVSYGERVSVSNDNGGSGSRGRVINQNFNVHAKDADSFRRSEGQILRTARRRLGV